MIARRWPAITSVMAGTAAIITGLVLLIAPASGPADAGPLVMSMPPSAPSAPASPASAPSAAPSSAPSEPPSDPPPEPVPGEGAAPPIRLAIPTVGVDAAVADAPVTRSGRLAVPDDARIVGWWLGGAPAGAPSGTLVLAGHVDDKVRSGALFRLSEVPLGATVAVVTDTRQFRYRVTARRTYAKRKLPAALFTRDGPHQLALITCGGAYRNGSYANNVVVYATPIP